MASDQGKAMSVRKFRCDLLDLPAGSVLKLEREEENHLFKILRALPGDRIELLDGTGSIASAEVVPGRQVKLLEIRRIPPPERRVHLYIAPPRRQKMDSVLREATELGVWRIVPMICEFSVSEPDASSVSGRWNDAMFEACKQSGNPYLPGTVAPLRFSDALEECRQTCTTVYFGSPTDSVETGIPDGDIAWFVGPEGGFSGQELSQLAAFGARPLRIGRWILRVETAAVAGIALLLSR